jgi:hypothetical protein
MDELKYRIIDEIEVLEHNIIEAIETNKRLRRKDGIQIEICKDGVVREVQHKDVADCREA